MSEQNAIFDVGAFWILYDEYVAGDFRNEKLNQKLSELVRGNFKQVYELRKNERCPKAWIALKYQDLFNDRGHRVYTMRTGDVVIIDYPYDRDIVVTFSPIVELVSGALLGMEDHRGLFFPVFDVEPIEKAAELRLKENEQATREKFEEFKKYFWR